MELGTFSLSLTVKDIKASRAFYEKLGFEVFDGKEEENWLILRHGSTKIGLFQGMFEKNLLTFNPNDARALEKHLKAQGIQPTTATQGEEGPAHFTLEDPDGNPILVDEFNEEYKAKYTEAKIVWSDLTVPDAPKVRDFYAAVVGWIPEEVAMGDYHDFNMKSDGKAVAGICEKKGVNAKVPSQWMLYINVANVETAAEKAKANGGKVLEIRKNEAGKPYLAYIEDPAGAVAALFQG